MYLQESIIAFAKNAAYVGKSGAEDRCSLILMSWTKVMKNVFKNLNHTDSLILKASNNA